jgi:hypothetical protein
MQWKSTLAHGFAAENPLNIERSIIGHKLQIAQMLQG